MGIMSIVKNVIEHFRKAGKTENEISGMIEQAADRATVNKGVTEKKEYKRPEIKVETSAEQFVEAVMQTGIRDLSSAGYRQIQHISRKSVPAIGQRVPCRDGHSVRASQTGSCIAQRRCRGSR